MAKKRRKRSKYDPAKNPPREVLEHIISEPPTDSSSLAAITDEDKKDMARLLEEMPELRNLETVVGFPRQQSDGEAEGEEESTEP